MKANYKSIPDEATPLAVESAAGGQEDGGSSSGTFLPGAISTQSSSFSWTPRSKGAAVLLATWCGMVLYQGVSPFSMDAAPWNLFTSSGGANTIKMCVKEYNLITIGPSKGAIVGCWDKDSNGDDKMTEGVTGADGCVTMKYKKQNWDGPGLSKPDIYCSVNKRGFVQNVPADKDQWDQSKQAVFDATLYRDRSDDYGHVNGCGAEVSEGLFNDIVGGVSQFTKQCFHHDKCYWDCKILDAFDGDRRKAQLFCDDEMYAGLTSECYWRHGNLPSVPIVDVPVVGPIKGGGEEACLAGALSAWTILTKVGGSFAYTLDCEANPESREQNDYDGPHCSPDGHKCGYDGTTSDTDYECNFCCNSPVAKDEGNVWDDLYCKCLPGGTFCSTTMVGRRFNYCKRCCKGSRTDDGWTYDNSYCK